MNIDMDGMDILLAGQITQLSDYERCWTTGVYLDQYCEECPHYSECSGSGEDDE